MIHHGTKTVHRNGTIQHIDLCPCHKKQTSEILSSSNLSPEHRSILDVLTRRLEDAVQLAELSKTQAEAAMSHLGYEATNIRSEIKAIREQSKADLEDVASDVNTLMEVILTRIEALEQASEQVTLWSLIKKCFTR